MLLHILGKIKILEDGFSNIISESILVGNVEYKAFMRNPGTEAESVIIVRACFSRPKKYRKKGLEVISTY